MCPLNSMQSSVIIRPDYCIGIAGIVSKSKWSFSTNKVSKCLNTSQLLNIYDGSRGPIENHVKTCIIRHVRKGSGKARKRIGFELPLSSTATYEICTKPTRKKPGVHQYCHCHIATRHWSYTSIDVVAEYPPQFSVDCVLIRSAALIKHPRDLVTDTQTDTIL